MKRKLLIKFFVVLIFSGCGVWTDFTTYFNRYYNTKTLFAEAEEIILKGQTNLFDFRISAPAQAKLTLDKVVESASKLLQYNSESSYVNESLFIIGKTFYYQQNFLKAERKFSELDIANDEELDLQNQLWLGKTKLQLRDFDQGLRLINSVIDSATIIEDEELVTEGIKAKVSFWIYREDLPAAITECRNLLDVSDDDEMNARVSYELGLLYLLQEDDKNAIEAFAAVHDYSPTFEIQFLSALEEARLRKDNSEYEKSLEILEDLISEPKFEKDFHLVESEFGQVYYLQGRIEEAIEKFNYIDTAFAKTEAAGVSSFMRARIFEDENRFDSALVYYSRCATGISPPEFKDIANEKRLGFRIYVNIREELRLYQRQLSYSLDSLLFIRDSISFLERRETDSLEMVDQALLNNQTPRPSTIKRNLDARLNSLKPKKTNISSDSLRMLITRKGFELGDFFFSEGFSLDSAKYYFDSTLENIPDSLVTPNILFTSGGFYEIYGDSLKADSLYEEIYYNYSTHQLANEAASRLGFNLYEIERDTAKALYRIAEDHLFGNDYDVAIKQLKRIYNLHRESLFAPKSLYAVGWIFENKLELADSATIYYDLLVVKYPETEYAKSVNNRLKFYQRELGIPSAADTMTVPIDQLPVDTLDVPLNQPPVDTLDTPVNQPSIDTLTIKVPEQPDTTITAPADSIQNIDAGRRILLEDGGEKIPEKFIKEDSSKAAIPDSLIIETKKDSIKADTIKVKNKKLKNIKA